MLMCVFKVIEEDVCHGVGPVHKCTANTTALPFQMYIAVRLDVDNSGWARPSGKIFVGGLLPEFNLVVDL
eukprot:7699484-Prorocentrum_lima.AAC.1